MSEVLLFKRDAQPFEPYGEARNRSSICRLIGPELSSTMGAGVAKFDGEPIEWTVLYDELIVTLDGEFRLRVGDRVFTCTQGDVLWVPENTALAYEGTGATVFYVLYPVDWRARAALS